MAKNSGLGRGLDALFSESAVLKEMEKTSTDGEIVKNIKIVDIEPNTEQARKTFSEDALNELAKSIKTYGVLQPIIVENKGKYYRPQYTANLRIGHPKDRHLLIYVP